MAEIDFKTIKCSVEDCKVHETGLCVEGVGLDECRNHKPIDDAGENDENDTQELEVSADKEPTTIDVYEGEAMEAEETKSVTAESLTRLVLLAGFAYTGKTTLLASLFDLFQQGAIGNYCFAGSKTLIGLERRCHDSRITSGRSTPSTQRTVIGTPKFMHLKVYDAESSSTRNLLFTDIAGEHFKQLTNSADECRKFTLATRADHFVLFLDADMLSNLADRQRTKLNAIGILRGLIEVNSLTPDTFIQVVFSRWDLLEAKKDCEDHKNFVQGVKDEIKSRFPEQKWNIRFFEVASRPSDESPLEFGHGISPLLKIWSEESTFLINTNIEDNMDNGVNANRQFSKFRA